MLVRLIIIISFLLFAESAYAYIPWTFNNQQQQSLQNALNYISKGKWSQAINAAKASKDPQIIDLTSWLIYKNASDMEFNPKELSNFLNTHEHWPNINIIARKVELSAKKPENLHQWLKHNKPQTGRGMLYYAIVLINNNKVKEGTALFKHAWVNGNFQDNEVEFIINNYRNLLEEKDFISRIDRLIWDEEYTRARKELHFVPKNYMKYFDVRMKLLQHKSDGESSLKNLDDKFLNDPALIFARIVWNDKRKKIHQAMELIKASPKKIPNPEKWWEFKNKYSARLLDINQYDMAYQLVSENNLKSGSEYAEAEWKAGWISYYHLQKYNRAYQHFYNMFHNVTQPVSLARAAYWAGRSANNNNNINIAKNWFKIASEYPSTFYGQEAMVMLDYYKKISLPDYPQASNEDKRKFANNDLAKIINMLISLKEYNLAKQFIEHSISISKNRTEMAMISEIPYQKKLYNLSVKAGKEAIKTNNILTKTGYPIIPNISYHNQTQALVHSIIRQESVFDSSAKSNAGAIGLMQLMPKTAKEIARKNGIKYDSKRLIRDQNYNIKIGTKYIQSLLNSYNGSVVLAIAAYNAGPGNVNKWIKEFGDPRTFKKSYEVIDWIEQVPFKETRNYIQRVMENMRVYKFILGDDEAMSSINFIDDLLGTNKFIS